MYACKLGQRAMYDTFIAGLLLSNATDVLLFFLLFDAWTTQFKLFFCLV